MKKHLILSLIAAAFALEAQAMVKPPKGDDVSGQTFMSIRPEFQSAFPEKVAGFRDRAMARCDGHGGAFQFVPFGGRSTNAKDLMKYFAPSPKTTLIVDSNPANLERDINPINFGLLYLLPDGSQGSYSSELQFRPQRTVGGLGITYRQYVGRECDVADRKWWFELSAPILHVSNKMNLTEVNITTSGDPLNDGAAVSPINMTQAFTGEVEFLGTGSRMQYGLINDNRSNNAFVDGNNSRSPKKAMTATGSDIELKLGYDYYNSECSHFGGYVGLHIPASRKPNGRYVFEAIPGFNQHFGFMTGLEAGVEIWRDCDRSLSFEVETNHRYFVQNTQVRSFDLRNRPWSRYQIVRNEDGSIQPGINVFTRAMKVHPRYSFDINSAFVYNNDCGFTAELGYNFYARQAERVALKEAFPTNLAIAGFTATGNVSTDAINRISNIGDDGFGFPRTAECNGVPFVCPTPADPTAVVTNSSNFPAQNQGNFVPGSTIRPQDLNLLSAATPAALTNLIYGQVGYNWDNRCYPLFVGLGGSYEFTGKNTSINRWLVWGKFGVSI